MSVNPNIFEAPLNADVLEQAMDYDAYRALTEKLVAEGKTTGPNQSEFMIEYTKLNFQRMKRHEKTFELRESLKKQIEQVDKPQIWLLISEPWCGDAAQNVPQIAKMAEANPLITLKIILRDEHLDIMDAYLTNGGRSIPKLIAMDAKSGDELGTWGPRPALLQAKILEHKENPKMSQDEFIASVHKWYADNKNEELQNEFELQIAKWHQTNS